jgi:hypothetical protein
MHSSSLSLVERNGKRMALPEMSKIAPDLDAMVFKVRDRPPSLPLNHPVVEPPES